MSSSKESMYGYEGGNTNKTLWDYFAKGDSAENAQCLLCSAVLKLSQRSRKGLVIHLKSKHCIDLKSQSSTSRKDPCNVSQIASQSQVADNCEDLIPKKKAKTIDNFLVKENSMEKMISRMIAKDGFTFNTFCKSIDLRNLFLKSGFKLPTSPNTIRSIVITFANSIKANIINRFTNLQEQNQKFSLTFDEWTSRKNKRYLNINVHYKEKHFNLGLVRIYGSCTAEHCVNIVEERLKSFNLDIKSDIICITTDGASVMRKVGRLMPCYHQLCYAHGIQLAVIDVLYKKNAEQEVSEQMLFNMSDDENDDDEDEEGGLSVTSSVSSVEIVSNYKDLITKVRNAVKIFKKSPTKNDIYLQKYVQEEHGKRFELILDCKTRWNSLLNMLERFYNLKLCISKALIDIESEIHFTDEEWSKINDLKLCLEPIKLGLEVICRRDSTLIIAETTFRFILEKLDKQRTLLSADLAKAFRERIRQRRTDLTGALIYLQNSSKFEHDLKNPIDTTFTMPKKTVIRKEIKSLLERVVSNTRGDNSLNKSDSASNYSEKDQNIQDKQPNLSLQEELEYKLQNDYSEIIESEDLSENIDKILKKEMSVFEGDGTRGKYLRMAYEYLLTVTPTSVEAERAFSAAGYLCNNLRSSLGDETINSLCFLRSYFQSSTN